MRHYKCQLGRNIDSPVGGDFRIVGYPHLVLVVPVTVVVIVNRIKLSCPALAADSQRNLHTILFGTEYYGIETVGGFGPYILLLLVIIDRSIYTEVIPWIDRETVGYLLHRA